MALNKKGDELSMNVIIIAILTLLVLVVLTLIFIKEMDKEKDPADILIDNSNGLWTKELQSCHDGCLYAEKFLFAGDNLSEPSQLYEECSKCCWKFHNDGKIKLNETNCFI